MLNFTKPKTVVLGSLMLTVIAFTLTNFNNTNSLEQNNYSVYSILFVFGSLFISIIGYSILWFFAKESHKILSILNLIFLLVSLLFFLANFLVTAMIFSFLSIQANLANMFFGFVAKTNTKKKI